VASQRLVAVAADARRPPLRFAAPLPDAENKTHAEPQAFAFCAKRIGLAASASEAVYLSEPGVGCICPAVPTSVSHQGDSVKISKE
jgi:hypothetical protein